MKRENVESSSVRSVGYEQGVLEVEFLNGGVYQYVDVPPEEHAALLAADSIGRYVNLEIKPFYSVRQVARRK